MASMQKDLETGGAPITSGGAPDPPGDFSAAAPRWESLATRAMLVLVAYTAAKNLLAAASKPFWYDELCTVAVAGQASLAALWNTFLQAKDSNPPFYCLVAYIFRHAVANQEIAYRLPSILGFACVLWCIFAFIRRHSGSVVALLCASILILPPYRFYAVEARPYSLIVACIAIALVCYQRAPRIWAMLLMALSLAAAEASYYYAVFAFVPFAAAEAVYIAKTRRVRCSVWLSLAAGMVPLAAMWPLLRQLQRAYGSHFWSQPSLRVTADTYALLFQMFAPLALGLAAALCLISLSDSIAADYSRASEEILAAGFLVLPLVAYAATKLAHGGLTAHYSLPAVLGLSLGAEHVLRGMRRKAVLLFALVLFTAIGLEERSFWTDERGHLGKLDFPLTAFEDLVSSVGHSELPVVVSDGLEYVQLAHYAPPQWVKRFVGVVDARQAVVYAGSDSVDLQMFALRCCLPLQVQEFDAFAAVHPEFLLYSDGGRFDWWPARLTTDGYSLRLVNADEHGKMYLVHRNGN